MIGKLKALKGNFQDFHELMGIKVSEIIEPLTEITKTKFSGANKSVLFFQFF